jgi:hypothetical protein
VKSWIHEAIYGYPLDIIQKDGPNPSLVDKTRKYKVRPLRSELMEIDDLEDTATLWSGWGWEDYDCQGCS